MISRPHVWKNKLPSCCQRRQARKKRQEFKAKQPELKLQFKVEQADKAHELQHMQLELQTEMMQFFRQQSQSTADVKVKQNDSNNKQLLFLYVILLSYYLKMDVMIITLEVIN